jgi:hypothetical protein
VDAAVRIVTPPATPTAVISATTSWAEFPGLWRELLAEVWAYLRDSDLRGGRNVMLYKDDLPCVEVGAEVSGAFVGNGRIVQSSLPGGRAAATVLRGEPTPAGLARAPASVRRRPN